MSMEDLIKYAQDNYVDEFSMENFIPDEAVMAKHGRTLADYEKYKKPKEIKNECSPLIDLRNPREIQDALTMLGWDNIEIGKAFYAIRDYYGSLVNVVTAFDLDKTIKHLKSEGKL